RLRLPALRQRGIFTRRQATRRLRDRQEMAAALPPAPAPRPGPCVGTCRRAEGSTRAQAPYSNTLPKGRSSHFAGVHNFTLLKIAAKEGAIDFRSIKEGHIQARLVLGKFTIGGIRLSSDRKWLALEQHPLPNDMGPGLPDGVLDVGVYTWPPIH